MIGFLVERLIRGEALVGRERDIYIEQVTGIFAVLMKDTGATPQGAQTPTPPGNVKANK